MNIITMCRELLAIEQEFPNHCVNFGKYYPQDFQMETFVQMWGNTSGGFEGIGGDMMTSQRTYVFIPEVDEPCQVYFGGMYAYSVPVTDEKFLQDVRNRRVAGCSKAKTTYKNCYKIG